MINLIFLILISIPSLASVPTVLDHDFYTKEGIVLNHDILITNPIVLVVEGPIEGNGKFINDNIIVQSNLNKTFFSNPDKVVFYSPQEKNELIRLLFFVGLTVFLCCLFMLLNKEFYFNKIPKKQYLREVITSFFCYGLFVFILVKNNYFMGVLPHNIHNQEENLIIVITKLLFLLLVYDSSFYWFHYLMHKNIVLYKWIHQVHHWTKIPTPLSSFTFNILEIGVNYVIIVLMTNIVSVNFLTIKTFFIINSLLVIYHHFNLELMPKRIVVFLSEKLFIVTPTYHKIHHDPKNRLFHLGFAFTFWDKINKTYYKKWEDGYENLFKKD